MTNKICVEFDGVIHCATSGWKGIGNISDPPVIDDTTGEHVFDWLRSIEKDGYEPVIYSHRATTSEGIEAIRKWFIKYGAHDLAGLEIVAVKPVSVLQVSERAWCFQGRFPQAGEIASFKPWKDRAPEEGRIVSTRRDHQRSRKDRGQEARR